MNSLKLTNFAWALIFVCLATAASISKVEATQPDREKKSQQNKLDLASLASHVSQEFGAMNPAIATRIVKGDSIKDHIESMPNMCQLHVQEEVKKLENNNYSRKTWMKHVGDCKCYRPLVENIRADYVSNVSALPHVLVFFDNNSSEIRSEYRQALKDFFDAQVNLNEVYLLVIGRASSIGDVSRNRELSKKRVLSIERFLEELGTDPEAIDSAFFGEEPPSLDEKTLRVYGISGDSYHFVATKCVPEEARLCKMNQSVNLVA